MTNEELANILFPNVKLTIQDIEKKYPKRKLSEREEITRFGASPTGYINIGGLYTAFIAWKLAEQTKGHFILRIEDNNQREIIDGGINDFVSALLKCYICFDEGYFDKDNEVGIYGPYSQTARKNIYQVFIKDLVAKGIAYPCFCSLEDLDEMRNFQRKNGIKTGYYGKYAKCRNLSLTEAADKALNKVPFTIRIKSEYLDKYNVRIYNDLIKGKVKLKNSDLDIVIMKQSGIPDYNFAHVIDDHYMGTTTITRCEDWLPSLHTHLALFDIMGWTPPNYAHIGAISIKYNNSIVKVSKKLGEKVTVKYFLKKGYIPEAIHKYFMITACADYEEYWLNNKEQTYSFEINKMSAHGALLDIQKLDYVSKKEISKFAVDELYERYVQWIEAYYPEEQEIYCNDSVFTKNVITIIRGVEKPRMAIAYFEQLHEEMLLFVNAPYKVGILKKDKEGLSLFKTYIRQQKWTDLVTIKESISLFCASNCLRTSDFCMILRKMIVGREKSPSVYEMLLLLGKDRIIEWIKKIE